MTHAETNIPAITWEEIERLSNTDQAFAYSVRHKDVFNMRLVLRAYGYAHTSSHAERAIRLAPHEV